MYVKRLDIYDIFVRILLALDGNHVKCFHMLYFSISQMNTGKSTTQVSFAEMDEIFSNPTPKRTAPTPKVEELVITNDIPKKGRVQTKVEEKPSQEPSEQPQTDPRPSFTSTPVFKYIVIGLLITAIVIALIYVVRTYVLKPKVPATDEKDETIRSMSDEIMKLKEREEEITRVVSQLRKENQLKDQLLSDIKEQERFNGEMQTENTYTMDPPSVNKELTDREKVHALHNERMKDLRRRRGEKSDEEQNEPEEDVSEGAVEEDEGEYEAVEEDEAEEEINERNGTINMNVVSKNSKKKNIETDEVSTDDIMRLVSST